MWRVVPPSVRLLLKEKPRTSPRATAPSRPRRLAIPLVGTIEAILTPMRGERWIPNGSQEPSTVASALPQR